MTVVSPTLGATTTANRDLTQTTLALTPTELTQTIPVVAVLGGVAGGILLSCIGGYLYYRTSSKQVINEGDAVDSNLQQVVDELELDTPAKSLVEQSGFLSQQVEKGNILKKDPDEEPAIPIQTVAKGMQQSTPSDTVAERLTQSLAQYDGSEDASAQLREALQELNDEVTAWEDDQTSLLSVLQEAETLSSIGAEPSDVAFEEALSDLNQLGSELNRVKSESRTQEEVIEGIQSVIDRYQQTVSNYDNYYHQEQSGTEVAADVANETQVQSEAANRLLSELSRGNEDAIHTTLEEVVSKLESYEQWNRKIDLANSKVEIQRRLDELSESAKELQNPLYNAINQRIESIENTLNRSQVDSLTRYELAKRVNTLEDVVRESTVGESSGEKEVETKREDLESELDTFDAEYIRNEDRSHFDHTIPNYMLELVDELIEDSRNEDEATARAYLHVGEQILDKVRRMYHQDTYNVRLEKLEQL